MLNKVEDTHIENAPSNETEAYTKSMNICFEAIGALNQLFMKGTYNKSKFSKNEAISGKSPFFLW